MLLLYSKVTGNFPIDRFVVTACISFICMIVLLSVAVLQEHNEGITNYERIDYDFDIIGEMQSLSTEHFKDFEELSDEQMKSIESRMKERSDHVNKACRQHGLLENGTEINAFEFFIEEKKHLIWCNIFKAASTTWLHNFNRLALNYTNKYDSLIPTPHLRARLHYPRPSVSKLLQARANKESTAFLIVRHPFERLSSAYRDKIQNCPPAGMYADLAEEIILHYRKGVTNAEEGFFYPLWPSFEEFIRYILDQVKSNSVMDIHWTPYVSFCTPCQFNFDVIVKFETIEEDQKYLVQKTRLAGLLRPHWKNAGHKKTVVSSGKNTTELMIAHYSQLTNDQITQLYEFYKFDFLLFNYTVDDYYKILKNNDRSQNFPRDF